MKIWANSGDSHLVEPDDLFTTSLPSALAERMPRSVKDPDGRHETIYVDGQEFRRRMPKVVTGLKDENGLTVAERAPGANDMKLRLVDLDQEGIWAELVYPSIGIWMSSIADPKLLAAGCAADQRLGDRVPAVQQPLRAARRRSRCSTPSTPSPRSTAPPTSGSRPPTSR